MRTHGTSHSSFVGSTMISFNFLDHEACTRAFKLHNNGRPNAKTKIRILDHNTIRYACIPRWWKNKNLWHVGLSMLWNDKNADTVCSHFFAIMIHWRSHENCALRTTMLYMTAIHRESLVYQIYICRRNPYSLFDYLSVPKRQRCSR